MTMVFATYLEQLRYVQWSDDDAAALRKLLPHVEPRTPEIAEEFYERIREHPEADQVFRDEAQVRRLKQTLQRWVLELLRGPYDEQYFENRCRIGTVHARVGLPQRYVFTAMSLIRLHLLRIAAEAFAGDAATDLQVRVALGKVLDVELSVMLETYRSALLERVTRIDRVEREGLAKQLAAADERYRDAIESSPAMVMALDQECHPLVWNHAIARVTGYERDELLDRDTLELLFPDADARSKLLAVSPGSPDTFEASLRTRAGRDRHVRWSVSATIDAEQGRPVLHAVGIDVTDVREAERRARNAERLAAVGTMAAGLAHEIRNPLNAASLHVTLLERMLKHLPSEGGAAMEAAGVLRGELKRLSTLVSEFLDFARPRPLRLAVVDLSTLAANLVELLGPDAESREVTLDYEKPGKPVWGEADEERLRQVLINLVRNAIEAVGDQGGGRVLLRVRRVGSNAEIDVEDNGPGVPESAPIFDAFFTTKEQGTGLGLSIVHRIVDDHGGAVSVRSAPGETVFTVKLPGALAEPPS